MKSISNIKKLVLKGEEINTNNGWGFGWVSVDNYIFKDCSSMFIGKRYYRHTGSSEANVFILKGSHVTQKEFLESFDK